MPKKKAKQSPKSLWKGPKVDGITQSMLSNFVVCRERFRIKYVLGLKAADQFNHRIEYGNMWHVCEEANLAIGIAWESSLKEYAKKLCQRYPLQQEQVQHWYNVCKTQFPIYVDYWAKHKDTRQRTSLLQEQTFDVAYTLPSGRVVRLRGKWDEVDLIGKGRNAGIYLQENKTKGDIKEDQLKRQLQFDLQTMFYLIALTKYEHQVDFGKSWKPLGVEGKQSVGKLSPIKGVYYNVVRRPLSGGKGSIRQHKATKTKPAETSEAFYQRLGNLIAEEPEHYFMRWRVEVTPVDLKRFKREFLNPILEQLYNWWEAIDFKVDPFIQKASPVRYLGVHWLTPFVIYNILAEGGSSEVDEYLATGSTLGLEKADRLFKELD